MSRALLPRFRFAPLGPALLLAALLAGCVESAEPILTGAQPILGSQPRLQLYTLRDGAAREPASTTLAWRDGRYVRIDGDDTGIEDLTFHGFEGADLLVQSIRAKQPTEYAIARKLADGTYLVFAIDEGDADERTRSRICGSDLRVNCRVTTREELLSLARATAARPRSTGALAVLLAAQ